MFRPTSATIATRARLAAPIAGALMLAALPAGAQTIADYSRAQRALLENAMTQSAARSAGVAASTPSARASAPVAAPPALPRVSLPPPAPPVLVSGVFASSAGALAEVVVDATPYLLGAGERVPGTVWRVDTVAVDRVVLSRQGTGASPDAEDSRKVFALPPLR
jgi:hypothetical protein